MATFKKLILTSISLALVATSISGASDPQELPISDVVYICSAEFSSGYEFKNSRWLRERFRSDARYQVQRSNNVWNIYEFDEEYEYENCGSVEDSLLNCDIDGEFIMDLNTMKFSFTSTDSYVRSTRRSRDPVVLTLGTCVEM